MVSLFFCPLSSFVRLGSSLGLGQDRLGLRNFGLGGGCLLSGSELVFELGDGVGDALLEGAKDGLGLLDGGLLQEEAVVSRGAKAYRREELKTYLLLQHESFVAILVGSASFELLCKVLDGLFLVAELLVVGSLLLEQALHGAGRDGEGRRSGHDGGMLMFLKLVFIRLVVTRIMSERVLVWEA